MTHLYIHIPFCHRRCAYCDFNTYANLEQRIDAYVDALCTELRMLAEHRPAPPKSQEATALGPTIFFGGGTPTMLNLNQFERILAVADTLVPLSEAEITSEANPGTLLAPGYLRGLRTLGVNRLSMGVQSLHDPTLRMLGRIHTAAEAYQSVAHARAAGFDNLNLDFIFGLPNQSLTAWEQTLETMVTWEIDHFSLYSLILEEQTPLFAQVTAGRLSIPDDDATAAMYEAAMSRLGAAGYIQYEISNWVRPNPHEPELLPDTPGRACRHNLAYWLNSDYLAAGAGAHGHHYPERYANIRGVDDYIRAVAAGQLPVAERFTLSATDLRAETMMMGLRLNAGVGNAHFAARSGQSLEASYSSLIDELAAQQLITYADERLRLTPRGRMLGNQVFARFL